jgi:hypothetical protein
VWPPRPRPERCATAKITKATRAAAPNAFTQRGVGGGAAGLASVSSAAFRSGGGAAMDVSSGRARLLGEGAMNDFEIHTVSVKASCLYLALRVY